MEDQAQYETQEIVPVEETAIEQVKPETKIELYNGIATHDFSDEQKTELMKEVPDEYIDLRPDGLIYMPEIRYRFILNSVFGPGQWALMRVNDPMFYDNKVGYHGALYVGGKFLAESIGEQDYKENNPMMSKFTAIEAAKSDCITRCCKDLGIAWNLWNPKFIKKWKADNAIDVWCVNAKDQKKKKFWRLKTDKPIDAWPWKENGGKKPPPPKQETKKQTTSKKPEPTGDAQEVIVKLNANLLNLAKAEAPNGSDQDITERVDALRMKFTGCKNTEELLALEYKTLCIRHGNVKKQVAAITPNEDESNNPDLF